MTPAFTLHPADRLCLPSGDRVEAVVLVVVFTGAQWLLDLAVRGFLATLVSP